MCLPKNYRRLTKPFGKVVVEIGFNVKDVLAIDDQKQTLTIGLDLEMIWEDIRFEVAERPWWTDPYWGVDSLPLGGDTINQVLIELACTTIL